jgi:hypothetical protein
MARKSLQLLGFDPTTELLYEDGLRPIISGSMEILVPAYTQDVKLGFLFWDSDPTASGAVSELIRVEAKTSLDGRVVYYDGYASGLPEVTGIGTHLYNESGIIPPGRGDIVPIYPQDGWVRVKLEGVEIPRFSDGLGGYKPALYMDMVYLYRSIESAGGVIRNRRDMLNRGNKCSPFIGAQSASGGSSAYGTGGGTAVRVNLTNDSHGIPVDAGGTPLSLDGAETTAYIYEGAVDVSADWNMSIQSGGEINVTGNLVGKTYTVTSLTDNAGSITFEFTRSGYSPLYATFTLFRNYSGITYTIDAVPGVFEYNTETDTYTPTNAQLSAFTIGASGRSAYSGYFRIYESADGVTWGSALYSSSSAQTSYTYTPTGIDQKFIKVELYKDNTFLSPSMVDVEVIPIIWEALDGSPGLTTVTVESYKISETIPTNTPGDSTYTIATGVWVPSNGWLDALTANDLVGNPRVWLTTQTVTTTTTTAQLLNINWADPIEVFIQGPSGPQGVTGPAGTTYYTWVKYADSAAGAGLSNFPTGKDYIGLAYNKLTDTESTNAGDYTWSLIRGATGAQGITGPSGPNGITYYTWIKYADSAAGAGLSDSPVGKAYIGIAYNKLTDTESNTAGDYEWALFKGPTGPLGPSGPVSPRTRTGFLYYQSPSVDAPAKPTNITYNFVTDEWDGTSYTNWKPTAPTYTGGGSTYNYWYIPYSITETTYNVNQTLTLSFTNFTVQQGAGFTNLVTFTNLSTSGQTTIHGGNVTTDDLLVNRSLLVGTSTTGVKLSGISADPSIVAKQDGVVYFSIGSGTGQNIFNGGAINAGTVKATSLNADVWERVRAEVGAAAPATGGSVYANGNITGSTTVTLPSFTVAAGAVGLTFTTEPLFFYHASSYSPSITITLRNHTDGTVATTTYNLSNGISRFIEDTPPGYNYSFSAFNLSGTIGSETAGARVYDAVITVSGLPPGTSIPYTYSASQTAAGASTTLSGLSDTTLSSLTSGNVLKWNGSTWINNPNGTASQYLRGDGAWATPPNTTYSVISQAEIDAGTATTARTISGAMAQAIVNKAVSGISGYTHPTHPGDDFSIDTGPLTGATVISDLDINVTTDTLGHVTDANAVVSTRNLTAADIGAASSSHSHTVANISDFNSAVSTYVGFGTTTPGVGDSYVYHWRSNASSPILYVRQAGAGPLARFLTSSTGGATSSTSQLEITNTGGITATGNISALSFTEGGTALSSKYADASHTHSYLPLSGGNLTGTTTMANRLTIDNTGRIFPTATTTRRAGMYGNYDSTKFAHIWSIGSAYQIADDGTNLGSLYGMAYQYTAGDGHQILFVNNGTVGARISMTDGDAWFSNITSDGIVTGVSPALAAWGFRRVYVSATQPSMSTGDIWMEI